MIIISLKASLMAGVASMAVRFHIRDQARQAIAQAIAGG